MTHPLSHFVDVMADVEKEDLTIAVFLVHPEDAHALTSNQAYQACSKPQPRPEWGGNLIGQIWNAQVITTSEVDPGCPEALPRPGGLRGIMHALEYARAIASKYRSPPPPTRLQKMVFDARSCLITWFGGKLPFNRL